MVELSFFCLEPSTPHEPSIETSSIVFFSSIGRIHVKHPATPPDLFDSVYGILLPTDRIRILTFKKLVELGLDSLRLNRIPVHRYRYTPD